MIEQKINDLLQSKFEEKDFLDCFLVETIWNAKNNTLKVFIDCDSGLKIIQCQRLSRYLEKHLDEQLWLGEKYTLEVSSPGLDQPLKLERQYKKNVGRSLIVYTKTGETEEGVLKEIADGVIYLEKSIGKKKNKELRLIEIPLDKIDKAKVQIVFK